MAKRMHFVVILLMSLLLQNDCSPKLPEEVVFVWIDVTGSYKGEDRTGEPIYYKYWAVEDISEGVKRILNRQELKHAFKRYHVIIGTITSHQKTIDKLYEFPIYGMKWSEIAQIIDDLNQIPIEDGFEMGTDIYGTLEYMCRYIDDLERGWGKHVRWQAIYYSDMIHEAQREKPDPQALKRLWGVKITAVFCRKEEYSPALARRGINRYQEMADFLEKAGARFFAFEPPGFKYEPIGETYFERALER